MVMPLAGRLLAGKFRLLSEVGRGGMGAVWLARNIHVERDVALKLILPEVLKNPEIVARFRDEARVAARIGHPGICDILDFELTPIGPVIVMELLRGENLAQRIEREGRLPVPVALGIASQALVALEAAHRAGIIHRDLKPENLFLHQPGGGPMVVKLMDFGISKFTDRASGLTASGVIMGTPEYMAPEQIHGAVNADARTDIWAIGAVLYRALTGEQPFTGQTVPEILIEIASGSPRPIGPEVPPALAGVVLRCLRRAPAERWQSARELGEALQPFVTRSQDGAQLGSLPTLHSGVAPVVAELPPALRINAATSSTRKGSRWPQRLVGLALLGACCYGAWWYAEQQRPQVARQGSGATTVAAAPGIVPAKAEPPAATGAVAREVSTRRPGLLRLWGVLDDEPSGGTPGLDWVNAGLGHFAAALAQPLPVEPVEPVPTSEASTGEDTDASGSDTGAPAGDGGAPVGTAGAPAGAAGEPAGTAGAPAGAAGEPAGAAGEPVAEPPRLVSAGGFVTPSVVQELGSQHYAKKVCEAFNANKFLGIRGWKLANPAQAKLFTGVAGLKPGSYWTTANYRGAGKVVSLPGGRDRSVSARKNAARALCVAPQG
jgi:serine/threonine-protein kinase